MNITNKQIDKSVKRPLPFKLRQRLMNSFILIIFVLTGLNIFTLIWTGTYYKYLSKKIEQQVSITKISTSLSYITETMGSYINSGNISYIQNINAKKEEIFFNISFLMRQESDYTEQYYRYYDLTSMYEYLFDQVDSLAKEFHEGKATIYLWDQMWPIKRLSSYINDELVKINSANTIQFESFYSQFTNKMSGVIRNLVILFTLSMFFSFFLAHRFTLSVSRPIHNLALQLVKFGEGDLDIQIKSGSGKDEISVLGQSFNNMTHRIKILIEKIEEKAILEKKIKNQEIRQHETEKLLKESELALLQSQINPHFLFNTLNTISSLSQIEKAEKTEKVITSLSNLLRYNLKNQNEMVYLKKELEVVQSYMIIQKTRFADKIIYKEKIDNNLLNLKVPSMILQPLVENAVKHGLEPIGRQGILELIIQKKSTNMEIRILDNGIGIQKNIVTTLLTGKLNQKYIGIQNVMRRLELRYGHSILKIFAREKEGTECQICIPIDSDTDNPGV